MRLSISDRRNSFFTISKYCLVVSVSSLLCNLIFLHFFSFFSFLPLSLSPFVFSIFFFLPLFRSFFRLFLFISSVSLLYFSVNHFFLFFSFFFFELSTFISLSLSLSFSLSSSYCSFFVIFSFFPLLLSSTHLLLYFFKYSLKYYGKKTNVLK